MRVLSFRSLAPMIIAGCLITSFSCAHDQQLVSIDVVPASETFGAANIPVSADAGLSVQLRALGHYIHPPVTKDITNQVTWGSNDAQMFTINPTGLLTATGFVCGGSVISATVNTNTSTGGRSSSGAIVTGTMTANVVCFTGTGGGGGGTGNPTLTVAVSGSGTVASSPAGISCPSICSAAFTSSTPITLTATPTAPATNVAWSGCLPNGATCTITLTANSQVTATFF